MKKVSLILCSALLIGLLAGCGSNEAKTGNTAEPTTTNTTTENGTNTSAETTADDAKYPDGVYFSQGERDPKSGWQYYVVVTVKDGSFTDLVWNATSDTVGVDKVAYSEAGDYGMKAKGASAEWHEQADKVKQYLLEQQDTTTTTFDETGHSDAVSGVSINYGDFFALVDQALAAGPIVEGPYKDGSYHVEGADYGSSGWKDTVDVIIAAGNIVEVNFSGVNEAGEDKKQFSIDGKYGMKAGGASAEWHEEIALAEQYLIDQQNPASVTFDDKGKTDAISGVSISLQSYYDLTATALEQAQK